MFKKKTTGIILILVLTILLSTLTVGAGISVEVETGRPFSEKVFEDVVEGHWAKPSIDYVSSLGYINGYGYIRITEIFNIERSKLKCLKIK